ncbi:hypothetical protein ACIQGZ_22520 [Streptomyces sp. NPDC092296]|uniref:hypothetical protein n=1 Tax=Streptomyces sp. NPDC092296 TaxID=3366012 RepID=UPI0038282987
MTDSAAPAGREPSGGQLVPDFDRLPVEQLRNRIRSLTREQLRQLLAHEERHGGRTAVLELLRTRIAQVAAHDTDGPG